MSGYDDCPVKCEFNRECPTRQTLVEAVFKGKI